jgi:hypothetical protein
MLAVPWPFGCPARFTDTGGEQTRSAQTLLAFSPVPVALLGHATRPRNPKERKGPNNGHALRDAAFTVIIQVNHIAACRRRPMEGRPNSQGSDKVRLLI